MKLIGKICVKTSFIWVGNIEAERNEIVALYSRNPSDCEWKRKKIAFIAKLFVSLSGSDVMWILTFAVTARSLNNSSNFSHLHVTALAKQPRDAR